MRLKATLAGAFADAVRRAPRSATEPLSWAGGALLMATYGRRAALESLERAFPEWSTVRRWRTAFAAYRNAVRALIEFLHAPRYTEEELREGVTFENLEALDEARREGRGAIILTGHLGNWEWAGIALSRRGRPFAALFQEPRQAGLADRLRAARRAAGLETIERDDVRAALAWLKAGRILAIVMDQEPRRPEDGVVTTLFGRPTRTYVGPFRLARATGAAVFTAFTRRVAPGRYVLRMTPFRLSDDPDPERAAVADAAAFNARLEAAIRRDPGQWMWMYRRWKRIEREEATAARA